MAVLEAPEAPRSVTGDGTRLDHGLAWGLAAGLGAVLLLVAVWREPAIAWGQVLLCGLLLLGVGLGALYLVAIHHVTGARWATALRRVPESLFTWIPAGGALVLLAIVLGGRDLYPWWHATETFSPFKAWWLQPGFFLLRAVGILGVWVGFGALLREHSSAQDVDRDPSHTRALRRLSAAFLVLGSFALWLASYDWIMSLEPHWYSTLFGAYQFAGAFLAALATVTLWVLWLERRGPLRGIVRSSHLHDLGKLLFAFSTFWMYLWFSQFLLIWYGNLPEEGVYFVPRLLGAYRPLFLANVAVNWGVPFLVLLPRATKKSRKALAWICGLLLAGRWLDLYVMIQPPTTAGLPVFGLAETGALLLAVGVAVPLFTWSVRRDAVVPVGDPLLESGLERVSNTKGDGDRSSASPNGMG